MRALVRVLIEVKGGIVQCVHADNPDLQVILFDWDNFEEGQDAGEMLEPCGVDGADVAGELKRIREGIELYKY